MIKKYYLNGESEVNVKEYSTDGKLINSYTILIVELKIADLRIIIQSGDKILMNKIREYKKRTFNWINYDEFKTLKDWTDTRTEDAIVYLKQEKFDRMIATYTSENMYVKLQKANTIVVDDILVSNLKKLIEYRNQLTKLTITASGKQFDKLKEMYDYVNTQIKNLLALD